MLDSYNGTFEVVPLDSVVIDHRYQRAEKAALIMAISLNPNWELFGVPVCFRRSDGTLYCADGQQRIAGFRLSETPPEGIPIVWFPVQGIEEEAAVFVAINEFRKTLSPFEKHRGKIVAQDPATLAIERAVDAAGFTVTAGQGSDTRGIDAISALQSVYNLLGEEGVSTTLRAIDGAWPNDHTGIGAHMLRGVANVLAEQNGRLTVEKLSEALGKTSPAEILRKADELRFDIGGSKQKNIRRAIRALARV